MSVKNILITTFTAIVTFMLTIFFSALILPIEIGDGWASILGNTIGVIGAFCVAYGTIKFNEEKERRPIETRLQYSFKLIRDIQIKTIEIINSNNTAIDFLKRKQEEETEDNEAFSVVETYIENINKELEDPNIDEKSRITLNEAIKKATANREIPRETTLQKYEPEIKKYQYHKRKHKKTSKHKYLRAASQ